MPTLGQSSGRAENNKTYFSEVLKPHKCDNQLDKKNKLKKKIDTDIPNNIII